MNMQNLMMQAKKMQKDIEKTQKELESKISEGSSQIVTASVNGNGKLLSINESTKLATMQFGDKTNSNIPLNEVYLNEGALKDMIKKTGKRIKDAAKKTWEKIKGVLSLIGGFLIPVDEEIIAIGGRGQGVDSAAVLTPANMTNVFDLRFHEIIAMPRP